MAINTSSFLNAPQAGDRDLRAATAGLTEMKSSRLSKTVLGCALAGAALFAHAESFSCASGASQHCTHASSHLSWVWDGARFMLTYGGPGHVSEAYFDLGAGMAASFHSGVGKPDFASDAAFDPDDSGRPLHGLFLGEGTTFKIFGARSGRFAAGDVAAGAHLRNLVDSSASIVAVSAVPEPETYALMLVGLGALGWVARRRSRG